MTTHTNDSLEATKYDTFVVDCAGFANKAYDIKCKVVDTIGSWSESVYSITVTDNITFPLTHPSDLQTQLTG